MTEKKVPHTRIFDELVPQFGLIGAAVYGVVWRYAQMRDGQCHASYERLASDIGVTARTLRTHVGKLQEAGLLSVQLQPERGGTNWIDVTPEAVSGVMTRTPERVSAPPRKEFPTPPERVSAKDTNKKPVKRPLKATPSRKRKKSPFWNDELKVLRDHFAEVSGLPIPKLEGRAFASVTKSWKLPLSDMFDLSGSITEAKDLIALTVREMRSDKMRISAPRSIWNVALDIYARGPKSGAAEPAGFAGLREAGLLGVRDE